MTKYLPVTVYNPTFGNCSNNGITATHADKLVVVSEHGFLTQEDIDNNEYVVLEFNDRRPRCYPVFRPPGVRGMAGGSYVHSTDSRFRSEYGDHPIPVHDRVE